MTRSIPIVPAEERAAFASLQRRAASLGVANAFDYAMQFLLPALLVRTLPPEAFGQYRMAWLAIMTVMVLAPLNMPQVLYYFLPRATASEARLRVHITMVYLALAGLIGAALLSPWNPLLPPAMHSLRSFGLVVPGLMLLVALTFLLDVLPTIGERVHWQAAFTVGLSLLRTTTLGLTAWITGDLHLLLWMLLALLLFKTLVMVLYVSRAYGLRGPWFRLSPFVDQLRHAAPLGASTALFGLRGQADQWVVASLFSLSSFAAFSVATVLGPMVNLFRQSFNHVFLPSMSRLQSTGDLSGMVGLNSRANVMVANLVFPLLAFAFVFAEEIVTLVYTEAYVSAAPVMRVYIIGMVIFVIEVSSLMMLLREGAFSLRLNIALLVGAFFVSWLGARQFGLFGAALGSSAALYGDRYVTLRRIAFRTGIPLGKLQDWRVLGERALIAVLAGGVAWRFVSHYATAQAQLLQMLIGAAALGASYCVLWWLAVEFRSHTDPVAAHDSRMP